MKIRIVVLEEVTPCSFVVKTFRTKLLSPPSVQKKDCLTRKMEAVGSSETSVIYNKLLDVTFQKTMIRTRVLLLVRY
jgi:hypothetical protein